MQQSLYFKTKVNYRKEHGGDLSIRRRKSKRHLTIKNPFHVTLRSEYATGKRSLLRHKNMIYKVLHKASRRFGVKIYQQAICGNHIHLLVRATTICDSKLFSRCCRTYRAESSRAPPDF